jgi:agmatinase
MTSEAPTFSLPSGFLELECRDPAAAVCIAGIPFDIGTTNRSGARFGPQAIRQASGMLRGGADPRTFADPLTLSLADIGNFRIAAVQVLRSGERHIISAMMAYVIHVHEQTK